MFSVTTLLGDKTVEDRVDKIPCGPKTKKINYELDFFKKAAFLTVSG